MTRIKDILLNNKIPILGLILIAIGFWFFRRSGGEVEPLISALNNPAGQVVGLELLEELERLKSLSNIKDDFLSNPNFRKLQDSSVRVVPRPVGRSNLFIP